MTCGHCGGRIRAQSSKTCVGGVVYACTAAYTAKARCPDSAGVSQTRVGLITGRALSIAVSQIRRQISGMVTSEIEHAQPKRRSGVDYEAEMRKLDEEHARYRQLFAEGITPTLEALQEDLRKVEEKRRKLKERHAKETTETPMPDISLTIAECDALLTSLNQLWGQGDRPDAFEEDKAVLLRRLGTSMTLFVDRAPRKQPRPGYTGEYVPWRATIKFEFEELRAVGDHAIIVEEDEETAAMYTRGRKVEKRKNPFGKEKKNALKTRER